MPVIESNYRAPFGLRNHHLQTILPRLIRKLPRPVYLRERIETDDGDFLDLDWCTGGHPRLALISYGMEATPQSDYVLGMVRELREAKWDVLVWNYRGCSGEPNRKVHFYHGGLTGDLHRVITHALARGRYPQLVLIGFSLGGNLILNYMGHRGPDVPAELKKAVAISAPVDVADCAVALRRPGCGFYIRRFLGHFREKIHAKSMVMPDRVSDAGFDEIKTLENYDTRYTVPHFALGSWQEFYKFVSSRYVLPYVRVPTLIINAQDDPFMGPDCHPVEAARLNPNLHLETPEHGGHLGFITRPMSGPNWAERRVMDFLGA